MGSWPPGRYQLTFAHGMLIHLSAWTVQLIITKVYLQLLPR